MKHQEHPARVRKYQSSHVKQRFTTQRGMIMPKIRCPLAELNLPVVLRNGQNFRWEPEKDSDALIGVMGHRVWRLRRLDKENISYEVLARFSRAPVQPPSKAGRKSWASPPSVDEASLRDFFQLDAVALGPLYAQWRTDVSAFAAALDAQPSTLSGIRLLRQDPLECLLSFICSSNNHISRIAAMVERLASSFGEAAETADGRSFHDFPSLESLAADPAKTETTLKGLGFGYRAAFVASSCATLAGKADGGVSWLHSLRSRPYEEVVESLMELKGVGAKVADCVALMSLDKKGAIPVDVHVANITRTHFLPSLAKGSAVNRTTHRLIGEVWRKQFGPYAGWAQSVLFSADLKRFAVSNDEDSPPKKKKKVKNAV